MWSAFATSKLVTLATKVGGRERVSTKTPDSTELISTQLSLMEIDHAKFYDNRQLKVVVERCHSSLNQWHTYYLKDYLPLYGYARLPSGD